MTENERKVLEFIRKGNKDLSDIISYVRSNIDNINSETYGRLIIECLKNAGKIKIVGVCYEII